MAPGQGDRTWPEGVWRLFANVSPLVNLVVFCSHVADWEDDSGLLEPCRLIQLCCVGPGLPDNKGFKMRAFDFISAALRSAFKDLEEAGGWV